MRKKAADLPLLNIDLDICPGCSLAWLDGGELALLQLVYEASTKFLNAKELKKRLQELDASPKRKAEYEARLSKLSRAGFTAHCFALDREEPGNAGSWAALSILLRLLLPLA